MSIIYKIYYVWIKKIIITRMNFIKYVLIIFPISTFIWLVAVVPYNVFLYILGKNDFERNR